MKFTVAKQENGRKLFSLDLKCKTISVRSVRDSTHGSSFPAVVVSVSEGAAATYRSLGRACQRFGVHPKVHLSESAGKTPLITISFTFTKLTREDLHYIQKALPTSISVPPSEDVGPRDELRMELAVGMSVADMHSLREAVFRKKALFVRFQTEGPACVFHHHSVWCRDGYVTYTMPSSGGGGSKAA